MDEQSVQYLELANLSNRETETEPSSNDKIFEKWYRRRRYRNEHTRKEWMKIYEQERKKNSKKSHYHYDLNIHCSLSALQNHFLWSEASYMMWDADQPRERTILLEPVNCTDFSYSWNETHLEYEIKVPFQYDYYLVPWLFVFGWQIEVTGRDSQLFGEDIKPAYVEGYTWTSWKNTVRKEAGSRIEPASYTIKRSSYMTRGNESVVYKLQSAIELFQQRRDIYGCFDRTLGTQGLQEPFDFLRRVKCILDYIFLPMFLYLLWDVCQKKKPF